jgi:hypothetical protein
MSTREGLEPPRPQDPDIQDSGTQTRRLARDDGAPGDPAGQAWPPSWGEAPSSGGQAPGGGDGPTWAPPAAAQGPSWTRPKEPEPAPAQGPSWAQPKDAETQADQTQPGWGQGGGGGGYPTVPAWGAPPADAGSPRARRPSRWLAAVVAGVVLLASGYGISQALDDDTPTGAGIPSGSPAPVAAAPIPSGEEPAAAVAKALLPTVVEIRHGSGLGSGFVYDRNG